MFAFGTEAACNGIKMLFFLFEIVDVDRNRADKNDQKKEKKIDIDDRPLVLICCIGF